MNNIPKEKLEKILTLFHLLRNENRFKILLLLMEKEMNVSELQEEIGGTQSAELRKANLVKDHQEKRMRYYSIYDEHVIEIIQSAISHINEDC